MNKIIYRNFRFIHPFFVRRGVNKYIIIGILVLRYYWYLINHNLFHLKQIFTLVSNNYLSIELFT